MISQSATIDTGAQTARSLSANGVTVRYGNVVALDGVSVHVGAERSLALVGESGSGKTTLLRCFNRMAEPQFGSIEIGGEPVAPQSVIELRRRIGYVQQDGGLLPHWRVLRNVAMVPRMIGMPDTEAAAVEALDIVGMPARTFGQRFPHELSGGQRQRVALARALAARPAIILLDEPFGALDAITRGDLQEALVAARRALPVTMVLVTHDIAEAARLGDDIAIMRAGRIEQTGPLGAIEAAPATEYVARLLARVFAPAARLGRA